MNSEFLVGVSGGIEVASFRSWYEGNSVNGLLKS